ncbi:MAG TPA: hypothetical protein VMU69_22650 [Bradyrhizobium sp.]|nr:hypothetical protein [Bradyrhizobium sp.]
MALSNRDRLRRVVVLCASFVRNLAYYRAGQGPHGRPLLNENVKHAGFWRQVNSDCIDVCVLDWCKLFAERQGEHHWRKIVTDPTVFEAALLAHVDLSASGFDAYIQQMKTYRNKFVAHLDQEKVMYIPDMLVAQRSVWFLHAHVVAREAKPSDLTGLPTMDVQLGYGECLSEAEEIFRFARSA